MFGCHPHIAVDLALGRESAEAHTTPDCYISNLCIQLKKAYELAKANSRSSQVEQKRLYDRRIRGAFLEIGDRVLVRNVGFKGTKKIADKWSEQVYAVVSQPNPDIPVYEVKPEIGRSQVKVLHRNILLPIPCLPVKTPKANIANVETTPTVIAKRMMIQRTLPVFQMRIVWLVLLLGLDRLQYPRLIKTKLRTPKTKPRDNS